MTSVRGARLTPHRYPYLDYERVLARREIAALTGHQPRDVRDGISVSRGTRVSLLTRLTYVRGVVSPSGQTTFTDQARLEASASLPKSEATSSRQRTRYSAHGLHDYKGKFNPQIVRALGNLSRLDATSRVLDPFCGSGTTLLEALHCGWHALGLDLNPLAVLVANSKIAAVRSEPSRLLAELNRVAVPLQRATDGLDFTASWSESLMTRRFGSGWSKSLRHLEYLERWFQRPVLAQYAALFEAIREHVSSDLQPVFRVVASDLAREASLQDPGDLRMRRRKDAAANWPLVPQFLRTAEQRFSSIARARAELHINGSHQEALLVDSREVATSIQRKASRFAADAVITSPPYLTALPYIDTQRLSLCLLDLVGPTELGSIERRLTGAREIGGAEREIIESQIESGEGSLPDHVLRVCRHLLRRAKKPGNGFRRRNVPALTYRYFADMQEILAAVAMLVKPRAKCYMVLGPSTTNLGGKTVVIDTPGLLGEVAVATDRWRLVECLELNAYQRYGMHNRNSIRRESLIVLERN